jgi:uncharacterized protein
MDDPKSIIKALDMQPHPEGGWYTETFRDTHGGARGNSTAIYYLLEAGERSHWHRVKDAAETWHYYAGAPLALSCSDDGETVKTTVLGIDLANGQRPQAVISANSWQSAKSLGAFTLVGCTVAPGFTFEQFEMAAPGWAPGQKP